MSDTSLKKFIIPALLTTGAVFTALATPVVVFGSEKLSIEHGDQPMFNGPVREVALPYLGFAGLFSVGLGITGAGIQGWRKNTKRVEQLDDQVADLQQRLVEREHHLKAVLTSEQYLEKSGLNFFLEDETAIAAASQSSSRPVAQSLSSSPTAFIQQPISQPVAMQPAVQPTVQPAIQPTVAAALDPMLEAFLDPLPTAAVPFNPPTKYPQPAPISNYQVSTPIAAILTPAVVFEPTQPTAKASAAVQSVVSPLTAAQGFLSFARTPVSQSNSAAQPTMAQPAPMQTMSQPAEDMTIAKIQALQTQLQQIVTQIEALQTNLSEAPGVPVSGTQVVEQFDPALLPAPMRNHAQETVWLTRRAAS
jgi:TolA-binding protein